LATLESRSGGNGFDGARTQPAAAEVLKNDAEFKAGVNFRLEQKFKWMLALLLLLLSGATVTGRNWMHFFIIAFVDCSNGFCAKHKLRNVC
jgi:hypothetical protein